MSNSHCQVVTDWKTWASLWICLFHPQVARFSLYAFVYVCIQATSHLFSNAESALWFFLLAWILLVHWTLIAVIIAALLRITPNPSSGASHYHHCSKERCRNTECLQAKQTVLDNEEHLLRGDSQGFTGICEQDWTCAGAFHIWQRFEIKCLQNLALQQPCFMWGRLVEPLHGSASFAMYREWRKLTFLHATAHLWLINLTTILMHWLAIYTQQTTVSNRINIRASLKL